MADSKAGTTESRSSTSDSAAAIKDQPKAFGEFGNVPPADAGAAQGGDESEQEDENAFPLFEGDYPWSQRSFAYQFMPLRGMYYDVRRRLPFLKSDWLDCRHPRNWWTIATSIVRIYFINLMPALAYVLDMNHRTDGSYGVNEVILASALAAIVFPIFSVQPLTFVGVTGLINLVNYTQYNLLHGYYGLDRMDYLRVQAWSLIWAAGFHFLSAILNLSDYTRLITDMTSQTFGFYVGIVYIQKGIELLLLEFEPLPLSNTTGWLSVTIAILFTVSVWLVNAIGKTSYLSFRLRSFVSGFAFTAGCIFWTGFSHFPKHSLEEVPIQRLPITRSFFPTLDRSWFIDFWNIETRWIFVGAPLGFLITILFYFDHNVSSVMAQARQFPVRRPAGFHWDFFLLGITTLVSGFLGLPAPNGLVPQAPVHTDSLSVYKQVNEDEDDVESRSYRRSHYPKQKVVNTRVVEQRMSHLIVGLLTLGTMTRPLLVALGTMPRAVFAGVFILVGWGSIEENNITIRSIALFRDRRMAPDDDPLLTIRRSKIALFVGIQWLFFAMTFAISQTIAAIGFPVIITLLIPFRFYLVPHWFTPLELRVLDAPTATADVVLASIGHDSARVTGQGVAIAADTGIAGTEYERSEDREDGSNGKDEEDGKPSALQPSRTRNAFRRRRPIAATEETQQQRDLAAEKHANTAGKASAEEKAALLAEKRASVEAAKAAAKSKKDAEREKKAAEKQQKAAETIRIKADKSQNDAAKDKKPGILAAALAARTASRQQKSTNDADVSTNARATAPTDEGSTMALPAAVAETQPAIASSSSAAPSPAATPTGDPSSAPSRPGLLGVLLGRRSAKSDSSVTEADMSARASSSAFVSATADEPAKSADGREATALAPERAPVDVLNTSEDQGGGSVLPTMADEAGAKAETEASQSADKEQPSGEGAVAAAAPTALVATSAERSDAVKSEAEERALTAGSQEAGQIQRPDGEPVGHRIVEPAAEREATNDKQPATSGTPPGFFAELLGRRRKGAAAKDEVDEPKVPEKNLAPRSVTGLTISGPVLISTTTPAEPSDAAIAGQTSADDIFGQAVPADSSEEDVPSELPPRVTSPKSRPVTVAVENPRFSGIQSSRRSVDAVQWRVPGHE